MKRTLIFCLGIIIAATVLAQESTAERFTLPLSSPGKRAKIELGHVNGDIIITGYQGQEVIIEAQVSGSGDIHVDHHHEENSKVPAGMKRINANPIELSASENNNTVEINTESWKRRVDVQIKTPQNTDLELNTVHGKIEVSNINGIMEVSSVNGEITLQNVSGSVVSNTVNGSVTASFTEVTPGEPMSFITLNGDIDITLPSKTKATTKMRSDRGEIYTDFDMALEKSKKDVQKEDGEYQVSINSWVYGKINGGGAEYTLKNMQGNIIVRKGT